MEYENHMPLYMQQIYIWALKMNKSLHGLDKPAHMYTYITRDGGAMVIDLYAMHKFLSKYLVNPAGAGII